MSLLIRLHPNVNIEVDDRALHACNCAFGSMYGEPNTWDRFMLVPCVYPSLDLKYKKEAGWGTFKVYFGQGRDQGKIGDLVQIHPATMTYRWYGQTPHGETEWDIEGGIRELTIINEWAFMQGMHTCRPS